MPASYTMMLREYIEHFSQYEEGLSNREKIETGRPKLFDFEYPIFDESYRKVFETHFIRNFYFREIGSETEGMFKFRLETWLLINMPYFNKLFESELLEYDPLANSEMNTTYNKTNDKNQNDNRDVTQHSDTSGSTHSDGSQNSTQDGTATEDNFERELYSDNPDSRLALTANDGEGMINYAGRITEDSENNQRTTNSQKDETEIVDTTADNTTDSTGTDNLNSEINETEDYIQHRVGKIGVQTYPKLIQEHRDAFLRIEKDLFYEMQELFMLVY